MTEIPRFWRVILEALVVGMISNSVAVVTMNAVESSNVGLAQPLSWGIELALWELITTSTQDESAGLHRQVRAMGQPLLALLPPLLYWQVAVLMCLSFGNE